MATISEQFKKIRPLSTCLIEDIPKTPKILSDRFIGIEVEVEKATKFALPKDSVWVTKEDNSLRNGGIEFVSIPLSGQQVYAGLLQLSKILPKKSEFSPRTSIHVHLDVTDWEVQKVLQFILVYLSVESLLYKFVGKARDRNNFCVPLYLTDLPTSLRDFVKHIHLLRFERYSGLNLAALQKFGTLEFRQMHGTHDLCGKVVDWINLILSMVNYVESKNYQDVLQRILQLNTNSQYTIYLGEVFGPLSSLLNLSNLKEELEQGVRVVKYSVLSNSLSKELKVSRKSQFYKWIDKHYPNSKKYFPREVNGNLENWADAVLLPPREDVLFINDVPQEERVVFRRENLRDFVVQQQQRLDGAAQPAPARRPR